MLSLRNFILIVFILSSCFYFLLGITVTNGSEANWLDQDIPSMNRIRQAIEIIQRMSLTELNNTLNRNDQCPRNSGTNIHLHRMGTDRMLFTSDIYDGGRAMLGFDPSYKFSTFYGAGNKIFVEIS